MFKSEIEKRLNKTDYTRLPRIMGIEESFENITNNDHYRDMLQIADTCGIKYLSFYKLKNGISINNLIRNIQTINYTPNLPYIDGQETLSIAKVQISASGFEVISNFYTVNEIWVKSPDGRTQTLQSVQERRVVHIQFDYNRLVLVASIDPIGLGVNVSESLSLSLEQIFNNFDIDFNDTFDSIDLEPHIYTKIDSNEFRPTRINNKDENRNIEHFSEARNPNDSLTDQDCYIRMRNSELDINRMKLKNDDTRMIIELFGKDIIRVWNKSNWEQLNELKNSFIAVL